MTGPSTRHPTTRRRALAGLACAAAALLGAASCAPAGNDNAAAAATDTLVLRNFTLIDGTGGAPLRDAAMIVEGGKVSWVGPVAQAQAPQGAQTLDLGGKFVMPGLIDLHVHAGPVIDLVQDEKNYTAENLTSDLARYASFGVTTVLSMGTDKDVVFPLRNAQRESGRPKVARIYTNGQGIVFKGGYGGVPGINRPVSTPAEATAEVDRQAASGADFIKLWMDDELGTMPKMPPAISKAVIDAAHRHKLRALAHVFYLADAKMLVDQGIDGFVHSVRDQPVDQALIDAMKAKGVTQVAGTLSREAAVHAFGGPNPITKDAFFRQAASPAAIEKLESPEREKQMASNFAWPRLPAIEQQAKDNVAALIKGGVAYGFGTDAGPPGRLPGYSEHWELEELVQSGLTPGQAINAATGRAAAWLKAPDLGTLQPGKWADFVVLDADPLTNILNSRTINAVYIAGNRVPSVQR